jgi:YVTN family beta-propeller protein
MRSAALATLATAGFFSLIGCGSNYRPVVAAVNPVGPSAQPQKYAIAISNTGANNPGLVTIVDFSGDSVLITANVGAAPSYLVLNTSAVAGTTGSTGTTATTGYTINGDGTLNVFDISTSLITSQVLSTTLLPGANPVSIFPQGTSTYVTEPGRNAIAQFQGTPLALKQEFSVPNPIYVVGLNASPRVYALSQGANATTPGSAIGIDTTTNTPTATLPVGKIPVYGIMTADGKRAFVLNKGSNNVSVVNVQSNQLDTFTLASPANSSTINVGTAPLWADFAPTLSEMVVANAGTGTNNGTLSVISIPLCSAAAQTSNVLCDPANPVDAVGFGTVLANPTVGVNPIMVAVLQDGTRAYVANAGNTATQGSVSVVNLTNNTVTATIPLTCHPNYIAATTGTPTGKVYVTCPDSNNMTVIRTDIDAIDTTVSLQGTGVSVRVTAQ